MTIVCVDTNWIVLYSLGNKVNKIMPEADVRLCRSVKDAIDVIKEKGCDILITEIDLGGDKCEGLRLAQEAKELNPVVNIIFTTSGSAKEYAHQLVKIRYSGFLTKPFHFAELANELQNLRYG